MHADLSGQVSDAGVTVTLIHSGAHKVDGNPYTPLPDAVRERIQGEIDSIRLLFTETVAAGRDRRLTTEAALATEAECYCGAEAVRAGLADEVSDPVSAYATFADAVNGRGARTAMPQRANQSMLNKEMSMKPNAMNMAAEDPAADEIEDKAVSVPPEPSQTPAEPFIIPAPSSTEAATAVALARAEAAELATIGAQAARLGLTIDVAEAVQKGIHPDALRASVLNQLAARSDAAAIAVVPPPKSAAPQSPIMAAAQAAAAKAGKSA